MISIIVPVYNVEQYLSRCVESIKASTFADYEIILVDDGSKDGSGTICDRLAKEDDKIRVVHKQNGGLSSARNSGLDIAQGEYVFFLDSDDEIYPYTLETLYSLMSDDVDMVTGGYVKCDGKGEIFYKVEAEITKKLSRDEAGLMLSHPLYYETNGMACIHLYRRNIIEEAHLRFDETILFCEDTPFVAKYISLCQGNIMFTAKPIYKYYFRGSSLTGSAFDKYKESTFDYLRSKLEVYKTLKDNRFSKEAVKAAAVMSYDAYQTVAAYAEKFSHPEKKEVAFKNLINQMGRIKVAEIAARNLVRKFYYKLNKQ